MPAISKAAASVKTAELNGIFTDAEVLNQTQSNNAAASSSKAPPPRPPQTVVDKPPMLICPEVLRSEECQICYGDYEDEGERECMRLPCMHMFHYKCGNDWVAKHNYCPMCKLDTNPKRGLNGLVSGLFSTLNPTAATKHQNLRLRLSDLRSMSVKELKYLCHLAGVNLKEARYANLVEKDELVAAALSSKLVTLVLPQEF